MSKSSRAILSTGLLLAWIAWDVVDAVTAASRQPPAADEVLQTVALAWIWCVVVLREPVAPRWPKPAAAIVVLVSMAALPSGIALSSGLVQASLAGDALLLGAAALLLWAAVSLGSSFTILPAALGLRSGGPYRVVRHPIYAAYILGTCGLVLHMPEPAMVGAGIIEAWALCLRAREEEQILLAELPGYPQYCASVPGRLIPRHLSWAEDAYSSIDPTAL
jgi:protein-S-isoprenylcysteine O-methyltransferase Ste14